jgi:hypothetical protein
MREEVEHIGGDHLGRLVVGHREEGLQIMGDRPQRVRAGPAGDELEVGIDQRITQREAGLPRR